MTRTFDVQRVENNQTANRKMHTAADEAGLSRDQRRRLHDWLSRSDPRGTHQFESLEQCRKRVREFLGK